MLLLLSFWNISDHMAITHQSWKRRMKARAPPPPNQTPSSCKVNNEHKLTTDLGMLTDKGMINMKENLINRTVDFTVVFPDGEEQKNTVHGSKAVMDLLVELCSQHHLNPAHHTLELQSLETQQTLNYKPNTLIGSLDVWKIFLKEKVPEGKTKQPPPLKIPEKTMRLVVNYLKTQKAVVRVSPEVPLRSIIPVICEKCEVSQEYLVLLRDTFTGEELELTKSLNELGIKELYAWDRKRVLPSKAQSEPSLNNRETRSSTSCNTTEKEKQFLRFFKTNKINIQAEEYLMRMDRDSVSEGPLKSTTETEQNVDGVTTAPDSPSVNSCSSVLGPSLSLGNISGITASTEIKKRRAPPPPVLIPQVESEETSEQEKTQSQVSQSSSQNELQKKKRRAPPPPTPTIQNRTEEMEEKRKSTVGNGRHVPQKPPRGNTRGPPQLVIPPPPPYPPPDRDTVDPTVLYSEADVTDATKLVPKRNLQLSHDVSSMENVVLELAEIEDTISLSSCFASEDTTEDSGVISFPSDILSLGSQSDSMKSRDKSTHDQETLTEMNSMFVAQSRSVKNTSSNSDESGNIYQRDEDGMMEAKFENADVFIAALDKNLTAMESMHDDSENGSVSSEMNGASLPLSQNADSAQDVSVPVPVTIIDEVPEADIPMDPVILEKQSNENNNAGSFTKGNIDGRSPCLSKSLLQQQSTEEEIGHQTEEKHICAFETHISSCEKRNMKDAALEIISKNGINSEECKVMTSNFSSVNEGNGKKEKVKKLNEENTKEGLPNKIKTELKFGYASAKSPDQKKDSSSPSLWCYRVHNGVTNYEPKIGLTTFKVVPPKPQVKYFDRQTSVSTGAIKIDELGNLVTPNAGGIKKITVNTSSSETEETLIGRAKAYWQSKSMKTQLEEFAVGSSTKSVAITNFKPLSKITETKQDCLTHLKAATSPLVGSITVDSNVGPGWGKPPVYIMQSSVKTLSVPVVKTDKMELPFQKPQRTSSHNIASAIAKYIDPPESKTNKKRHDKEEMNDEKGVKTETEPLPKRCIVVAKYCPVETQPAKTKEFSSSNCSKNASDALPLGTHPRIGNSTANTKLLNQNNPTNCFSEPFTTASSKDNGFTGEKPSCGSIQNVIVRDTPSILNERKEQTDQASCPFFLRSPNAHSFSVTFNCRVKSAKEHPIHSGSSELNGTPIVNLVVSEKDGKLDNASISNNAESNIRDDDTASVFGPKKKFKPIIQKPLPEDTSLHSALMEAIRNAGGKENLRKMSRSIVNGAQKKPLFTEYENERSALLAAIRGHSGTSGLRKISSSASEELQSFRKAKVALQNREVSTTEQEGYKLPPPLPPPLPPTQLTMKTPRYFASQITDSPDPRQALMEAIRSGTGALRLRKVPLLV
ncbi:protein cordon-bleu isoform X2 [Rhineura floridana]|uniref:protein cordon-bleu isoform X2 n=1 Tax=Rhineura floridana TaxID=261503 RepID=UPI002AC81776|nr:protein cordon-bleu isoform X2 [Rhineura floridana]